LIRFVWVKTTDLILTPGAAAIEVVAQHRPGPPSSNRTVLAPTPVGIDDVTEHDAEVDGDVSARRPSCRQQVARWRRPPAGPGRGLPRQARGLKTSLPPPDRRLCFCGFRAYVSLNTYAAAITMSESTDSYWEGRSFSAPVDGTKTPHLKGGPRVQL